jgi:hypothetical protein
MMQFEITEKEYKKISKWQKKLLRDKAPTGAIGGRFQYTFTPNSIGLVIKVVDLVTKQELDITDYESW